MCCPYLGVMRGWDHPREYGENAPLRLAPAPTVGSSPRIRGESLVADDDRGGSGIIPANTGRMESAGLLTAAYQDHPREYGENG